MTSPTNSSSNTTSQPSHPMAGYTLKSIAVTTASPNWAFFPKISSKNNSTNMATTKPPQPQASGSTSGTQSTSALLLMTFESSTSVIATSITYAKPSKNTAPSPKI
ncbi:hypothetical protein ACHAW6_002663 [Cyclotella cf. meneghiniana]